MISLMAIFIWNLWKFMGINYQERMYSPLIFCARVIFAGPLVAQLGRTSHPNPHMQNFCSHQPICQIPAHFPKTPRSPERLSVRGPYARCFFRKFDFQKNFWYNFKKKHLHRAAHQKTPVRMSERGCRTFSQPLLFYFYDGNPGASILIKKWFSRQNLCEKFFEALRAKI